MDVHNLYSTDAEEQIIGVVLMNPDILDEIELSSDDFYIDKNRMIFAAMRSLHLSGSVPDCVTLTEFFDRQGKLQDIGGASYLTRLLSEATFSGYISGWVKIVSDYATRRRMIQSASRLANVALDLDKSYVDPLADIVDDLATGAKPRVGAKHWGEALSGYFDWLEQRAKNPGDLWGIPTGFIDYDRMTGGVQAGDLIYIAGEPGIGKTILTTQMGVQMAEAGYPGALYSLEMAQRSIIGRIISGRTKTKSRLMKSGRMSPDNWSNITREIEKIYNYPMYISDDGTLTTMQLRADLARLKIRYGLMWCVLDYDMLLNDGDGKLDEIQFSTVVSKRLKGIAKDLEIAMITVSSVTKESIGDDEVPTMRGVRGGAQKLHNADVTGFLTRHIPSKKDWETDNPNLRTFTFVKGRELESLGSFHLVKFEQYPAFGNYTKDAKL